MYAAKSNSVDDDDNHLQDYVFTILHLCIGLLVRYLAIRTSSRNKGRCIHESRILLDQNHGEQ